MNFDEYFINLAFLTSLKSKDPSTKTGVVIVGPDNEVRGIGYNGFPRNVSDDLERYLDRPKKLLYVVHAEENSLLNCLRANIPVKGCKMYTSFGPQSCSGCSKCIVQAGITEIIGLEIKKDFAEGRWKEEIDAGNLIFKEANIRQTSYPRDKFNLLVKGIEL